MTDETIFEGDHLRAHLMAGTRDRLIVTFDYRQTSRAGFNALRHSSTFARGGFWQLNIQSRLNDWFINADTTGLERALTGLRGRFGRVNLMGYSMGGYGALRFAKTLDANQAVLVSPQFSIAPGVVPFEDRYPAEAQEFDAALGDLRNVATSALNGLILVDPFCPIDMAHARLITNAFPGIGLARLSFAGHPATRVLRGAAKVWTLHREATAANGPDRRLICTEHRSARRASRDYWTGLAEYAAAKRPHLSYFARSQALALTATSGGVPAGA
jgi:pimeloyl-ACP methyl ester carboxylesterase